MRVSAYIDGFNLYHAIKETGQPHLKWVNLWRLCENFCSGNLEKAYYFTAYAEWMPDSAQRHREYVNALSAVGVTPVIARFKPRDRKCLRCGNRWKDHEEKETDVNIALHMLRGAVRDEYDRALLVTADSDLVPAVRMVRTEFPNKQVWIVPPVGRFYCMDLINAAGGNRCVRKMEMKHLRRSLFDREVFDNAGAIAAIRPTKYDPPATS